MSISPFHVLLYKENHSSLLRTNMSKRWGNIYRVSLDCCGEEEAVPHSSRVKLVHGANLLDHNNTLLGSTRNCLLLYTQISWRATTQQSRDRPGVRPLGTLV